MDEEENYFLFEDAGDRPDFHISGVDSPVRESSEPQKESYLKAYNPYETIKSLPPDKQKTYGHILLNNKTFPGFRHFF